MKRVIKNPGWKKIILVIILLPFALVVYNFLSLGNFGYYYFHRFTESGLNTKKEGSVMSGVLVKNPLYIHKSKWERGPEVFCHDNPEAKYLLELEENYIYKLNPPTYLKELWESYSYAIPQDERLTGKNVLPVFMEEKTSNIYGILSNTILDKYQNQKTTLRGVLVTDGDEFVVCKIFLIDKVISDE